MIDAESRSALHKFAQEVGLANRLCLAAYVKACEPREVRGRNGMVSKMGRGEGLPSLRRRCQMSMQAFRRMERALWGYLQAVTNVAGKSEWDVRPVREGWERLLRKRVTEALVVCRSGRLHEAYSSLAMPLHLPPLEVPCLSLEEAQQALQRGWVNTALTPLAIRELTRAAKAEADRATAQLRARLVQGLAAELSAETLGLMEAAVKRDSGLAGLHRLVEDVLRVRKQGVAHA